MWREGELEEKPPQHVAQRRTHAEADHESRIDLEGASAEDIDEMRRHYYANITTVDEKLGEVLAALEDRGWLDDTILVFCSDHGEMLGDHSLAYKWLMYDPITHIPLIIRYPDAARQGTQVEDLVSLIDLGPTILEAAGITVPTHLEGRSLLPYCDHTEARQVTPREYVYCEDNYQIMMRSRTHKMVYYIGQEKAMARLPASAVG